MEYKQKDFNSLLGIKGFSETMLINHFSLYGGYVKNVNTILNILDTREAGTPEYSELQRRFSWEWNGMKLHELYFGNMKNGGNMISDGKLKQKIKKIYGSLENWKKNFIAVGTMRGIGWTILAYDKESDELFNLWIGEHNEGHLCSQEILLAMDVWEHAYMTDYGIKRTDYINAFIENINWMEVEKRFEK